MDKRNRNIIQGVIAPGDGDWDGSGWTIIAASVERIGSSQADRLKAERCKDNFERVRDKHRFVRCRFMKPYGIHAGRKSPEIERSVQTHIACSRVTQCLCNSSSRIHQRGRYRAIELGSFDRDGAVSGRTTFSERSIKHGEWNDSSENRERASPASDFIAESKDVIGSTLRRRNHNPLIRLKWFECAKISLTTTRHRVKAGVQFDRTFCVRRIEFDGKRFAGSNGHAVIYAAIGCDGTGSWCA